MTAFTKAPSSPTTTPPPTSSAPSRARTAGEFTILDLRLQDTCHPNGAFTARSSAMNRRPPIVDLPRGHANTTYNAGLSRGLRRLRESAPAGNGGRHSAVGIATRLRRRARARLSRRARTRGKQGGVRPGPSRLGRHSLRLGRTVHRNGRGQRLTRHHTNGPDISVSNAPIFAGRRLLPDYHPRAGYLSIR
jgi:hypothetical protein